MKKILAIALAAVGAALAAGAADWPVLKAMEETKK